jgi:hypothetical protein
LSLANVTFVDGDVFWADKAVVKLLATDEI